MPFANELSVTLCRKNSKSLNTYLSALEPIKQLKNRELLTLFILGKLYELW